jgi:hypothetical protein
MSESVIESSGNVFSDLGFEPAEAAILHDESQIDERPANLHPIQRDDPE